VVQEAVRFLPEPSGAPGGPRVAVVGFGYVGTCLGVALAQDGATVVALDNDERTIADLRAGRCRITEPGITGAIRSLAGSPRLTATTSYDAIAEVDVVIITVGTPAGERGELLAGQLIAACEGVGARLRPGQLVIVKSTVPPGTTRKLVIPLLESGGLVHEQDFGLAFCPERLAEGGSLAQVRALPVIVGGAGPDSSAAAERFWRKALGVDVHHVPSIEAAETVKLATNWWIDANVAIANELACYCAALGVDVLDVIGAANTLPKGDSRINLLMPSIGVGGSCLTKDPWMVWRDGNDRGVEIRTVTTARQVNDAMPAFAAGLISNELLKLGREPAGATVAVLGAAFKSGTGDVRNTPALDVVRALRAAGAEVRIHDPLADPAELRDRFGIEPSRTLASAVAGADCLAFLAGHPEFHDIDFATVRDQVRMPALIFDGRIYFDTPTIQYLRNLGFAYRGIGR
jgi:nucleotide sugar dehydrogenase